MRSGCENALSIKFAFGLQTGNRQRIGVWAANCRFGLQTGVGSEYAFGLQIGIWAAIGVLAAKWRSNLFENRPYVNHVR